MKNLSTFLNESGESLREAPPLVRDFVNNVATFGIVNKYKLHFLDLFGTDDVKRVQDALDAENYAPLANLNTKRSMDKAPYYVLLLDVYKHESPFGSSWDSPSHQGSVTVLVDVASREMKYSTSFIYNPNIRKFVSDTLESCFDESFKKHAPSVRTARNFGLA